MMTPDERLEYLRKIEATRVAWPPDPELAAEEARASEAWDTAVGLAPYPGRTALGSPTYYETG